MFGLFTLTKNNRTALLFIFKNDKNLTFSTRFSDWSLVNGFNPKVLAKCEKYALEHYDKPYKLYYHNCEDVQDLSVLCKRLQVDPKSPTIKLNQSTVDLLPFS